MSWMWLGGGGQHLQSVCEGLLLLPGPCPTLQLLLRLHSLAECLSFLPLIWAQWSEVLPAPQLQGDSDVTSHSVITDFSLPRRDLTEGFVKHRWGLLPAAALLVLQASGSLRPSQASPQPLATSLGAASLPSPPQSLSVSPGPSCSFRQWAGLGEAALPATGARASCWGGGAEVCRRWRAFRAHNLEASSECARGVPSCRSPVLCRCFEEALRIIFKCWILDCWPRVRSCLAQTNFQA